MLRIFYSLQKVHFVAIKLKTIIQLLVIEILHQRLIFKFITFFNKLLRLWK